MKFAARKQEPASPAPNPMNELKALAAKIESFRSELNDYVDEHCRVIASGTPGVPYENIKMMITSQSNCRCMVTTKILNEKAVALEIERREKEKQ
jgi:hypothetical protein